MGNGLLAKAHITKYNKLTESKVSELTKSMVDETAWPILNCQECQGITIVGSQLKLVFDIETLAILTVMADRTIKTDRSGL